MIGSWYASAGVGLNLLIFAIACYGMVMLAELISFLEFGQDLMKMEKDARNYGSILMLNLTEEQSLKIHEKVQELPFRLSTCAEIQKYL